MEEIVNTVASEAHVDPASAQKAVGVVLNFMRQDGPADAISTLFDKIPGASEAADAAKSEFGPVSGGLMGLVGQLTSCGLNMMQMPAVGKALVGSARNLVGEDTMGAIIGGIPGLHQFV